MQRFKGHVQTDFVAVLEAVSHGLGGVEDGHLHTVNQHTVNALGQCWAGHTHGTDSGLVEPWHRHAMGNGQPDFKRCLGANAVHAQRRKQADHTTRHAQCHLCQ